MKITTMISYLLHIILLSSLCICIDIDEKDKPEMALKCPLLSCDADDLTPDVCYKHDGEPSARKIKG